MAIVWKLPMLEDYTIDNPTSIMDEPFAFEETNGRFAAKHYSRAPQTFSLIRSQPM